MEKPLTSVIIPAAGMGRRMNAPINKQYLTINGKPILALPPASPYQVRVDFVTEGTIYEEGGMRLVYCWGLGSIQGHRILLWLPPSWVETWDSNYVLTFTGCRMVFDHALGFTEIWLSHRTEFEAAHQPRRARRAQTAS